MLKQLQEYFNALEGETIGETFGIDPSDTNALNDVLRKVADISENEDLLTALKYMANNVNTEGQFFICLLHIAKYIKYE